MRTTFRVLFGVVVMSAVTLMPRWTTPAIATPSNQTSHLCEGASVTCSIQVAPVVSESSVTEVVVTGKAGATVDVQARQVTFRASTVSALVPFGPSVQVTIDANGFGSADLTLPALPDGVAGGPLLFGLGDATGSDVTQMLATWSVLASRTPHLQGDGYAEAKPVGVPLQLALDSAQAGTTFRVEYADANGVWQPASDPVAGTCPDPEQTCVVTYAVPRGLSDADHPFRLVNLTTGTGVGSWTVRPSNEGVPAPRDSTAQRPAVGAGVHNSITWSYGATSNPVPRPRQANLDIPDVGSKVEGIRRVGDAGPGLRAGSLLVAGLALGLAMVGVVRASRRRLLPRQRGGDGR